MGQCFEIIAIYCTVYRYCIGNRDLKLILVFDILSRIISDK